MITLNLLSPEQKHELNLWRAYVRIKNIIYLLLIGLNVLAVALLLGRIVLQNTFNSVAAETSLTTRYSKLFNEDLMNFKRQLIFVDRVQQEFVPWTQLLTELSGLVPSDVSLQTMTATLEPPQINLQGVAKTRDQLLTFRDNLLQSPLFSAVNLPIENLLQRENVSFELTATLHFEQLANQPRP